MLRVLSATVQWVVSRGMEEMLIEHLVVRAATRAVLEDAHLLAHDCCEMAFTHRVAVYLEPAFYEWNVDCEYNRDGHEPKTLRLDDLTEDQVRPDIIIHRRGSNADNLVVIEAKKLGREDPEVDLRKLRAFRDRLEYRVIAFLMLRVGTQAHPERIGAHLAFGSGRSAQLGTHAPEAPRANWFERLGLP
ncbi:MAG: hypothetical protein JWM82_896 [Myxococcales bacterium]|nr:hypothetical protein [Myxococcales bacterium]